ncbi:MAG: PIN domain-containing protein [Gemmatimonadetes bacterium]|nr:PIN domain-containing protein [Gemmatimonadota bacterium]NIO30255.1 PIN domain-containing protein [Gemmatimonadota bacterium]
MNVVDSSAWLEYFADGPNADFFAPAIEDVEQLIVPSITLAEVFRRVLQQRGEGEALQAIALMEQGQVVDLDSTLAVLAGKLGRDPGLPLADSIILATAHQHGAVVWTQDADFQGLEGARYASKR